VQQDAEQNAAGLRIKWAFNGGVLHGEPVLKTLRDNLQQVGELVQEAERKLG
jgi:hypothetical protein